VIAVIFGVVCAFVTNQYTYEGSQKFSKKVSVLLFGDKKYRTGMFFSVSIQKKPYQSTFATISIKKSEEKIPTTHTILKILFFFLKGWLAVQ
jgi:hypothetical protein